MANDNAVLRFKDLKYYDQKMDEVIKGINDKLGTGGYTIDSELSENSENAVQNKVITKELNKKINASELADWVKAENKPTYTASEVGADALGSANAAKEEANKYTDESIADLVNGAPETLDTLKELADAMAENENVVEALDAAIGNKADKLDTILTDPNKRTVIPKSSDIDDYTTLGNYIVLSAGDAETIANTPWTTTGYYLNVIPRTSTTILQVACTWLGLVRIRSKIDGSKWSEWEYIRDNGNATTVDGKHASDFALATEHNLKWYTSVTQFGMTINDTVTDIYNALPENSALCTGAHNLVDESWDVPDLGTVLVVKLTNVRAYIHFYPKTQTDGYVPMYMPLTSEGVPTGTWVKFSDGGNANLLDGKNSTEFAQHKKITTADELNSATLPEGLYDVAGVETDFPCGTISYYSLIHHTHNGHPITQIATITQGGFYRGIYYRMYDNANSVYKDWRNVTQRTCIVAQSSGTNTNPYYKVASINIPTTYQNKGIVFHVTGSASGKNSTGILRLHARTEGTGYTNPNLIFAEWEYISGKIDPTKFIMAFNTNTTPAIVEFWVKIDTGYTRWQFDAISEYTATGAITEWMLYDKVSAGSEAAITEGFTTNTSILPEMGGSITKVNGHTVESDVPANAKFTDTTYSNFVKSGSGAKAGLVPAPSTTAGTTKYLREDGTWQVPPNTTYTPVKLGQGYAICSTAEATTAKVVTLSNYELALGGMVAIKFTYAVPASATLNINSKGAKAIYNRGVAIKAGAIKAGDIATFVYNGSDVYHLLTVDRDNNTTYSAMTGATADTAGTTGLVPAPAAGTQGKYLRGDGTWQYPNNDKASQTNTTTSADYRVLLSNAANDTTETAVLRKSTKFTANPNTGVLTATTFKGALNGNADTATTATNVKTSVINPTTATNYYPTFVDSNNSSATAETVRTNGAFRLNALNGTASAVGKNLLYLGNGTAKGTAGNCAGYLVMYGESTGYTILAPQNLTGGRTIMLPASAGTLATMASGTAEADPSSNCPTGAWYGQHNGVAKG